MGPDTQAQSELRPVQVVLDANTITQRGWYLSGPNFYLLKTYLRQTNSKLKDRPRSCPGFHRAGAEGG